MEYFHRKLPVLGDSNISSPKGGVSLKADGTLASGSSTRGQRLSLNENLSRQSLTTCLFKIRKENEFRKQQEELIDELFQQAQSEKDALAKKAEDLDRKENILQTRENLMMNYA